jgi:3-hydroxyacyl-CoA dehydrogenase
VQYVKAGRLGRKAGRGVYDYPEAGKSSAVVEGDESTPQARTKIR